MLFKHPPSKRIILFHIPLPIEIGGGTIYLDSVCRGFYCGNHTHLWRDFQSDEYHTDNEIVKWEYLPRRYQYLVFKTDIEEERLEVSIDEQSRDA